MAKMSRLELEIGQFVLEHPHGWGHDDWLGFLHRLGESGQDVSNADGLGRALERAHLKHTLQGCGVAGLGPKRTEGVCDAFASLYHLRAAGPEEIAHRAGIPQTLAESLSRALR
jgi:hypothetical protein